MGNIKFFDQDDLSYFDEGTTNYDQEPRRKNPSQLLGQNVVPGQGLGSPYVFSFQGEALDAFTPYLGKNIRPDSDPVEDRAQAQSAGERWLNAAGRFAPAVVGKTLQSAGNILGLPAIAVTGDINTMIDNPIVNLGRAMENYMDESLPIYQKKVYTQGSFTEKLGTSEFWTIDFMDGLEFLTSAYATSLGVGAAVKGIGTKALQNSITNINKVHKTRLAEKLIQQKVTDAAQIAYMTEFGLTTALNTVGEAGIEAREMRDQLLQQGASMEVATKAASNVAIQNVGALLLSNAWQSRLFMGSPISKASRLKEMQKAFNKTAGKKAGEMVTLQQLQKGAEGIKTNLGREFLKQGSISAVTEGVWEENVQTAIQIVNEDNALHNPDYLNQNAVNLMGNIAHQMVDNFTETEGQSSIFLGAMLGLFGAAGSSIRDTRNLKNVDQKVLESIASAESMNWGNLSSFLKTKKDEKGNTIFDTDENGDVIADPFNAALLTFKLLEDKSLYDSNMAAIAQEDETAHRILSQMTLARDFFRHSGDKSDIDFFNAKKDILTVGEEEGYEGQIREFQRKYLPKLAKLAAITKDMAPIKGVSEDVNKTIQAATYYQGAMQFIIDELIAEQSKLVSNTGTPLDEEYNSKVNKRLEFLKTLKEDSENRFEKLTDQDVIRDLDKKGAFDRRALDTRMKEIEELETKLGQTTDLKEKLKLEEELEQKRSTFNYESYLESQKYGILFGRNKEKQIITSAKPPIFFDINVDEAKQARQNEGGISSSGLSKVEMAMFEVGTSYALREEIDENLKKITEDESSSLAEKMSKIDAFLTTVEGYVSSKNSNYFGDPTGQIDSIRALKNDIKEIEDEINNIILQLNKAKQAVLQNDDPIIVTQELTGIDQEGNIVDEERVASIERVTSKPTTELKQALDEAFEQEDIEGYAKTIDNVIKGITIFNNIPIKINQLNNKVDNVTDAYVESVQRIQDYTGQKTKLVQGDIYGYDNYFDAIITEEEISSLETKAENYKDPNKVNRVSDVEKDINIVKGGIGYYVNRSAQESSNQEDNNRFLKEFKELLKELEKGLKVVEDNEEKNKAKLLRIKEDIAEEKWNGLGRDKDGKVVDKDIDAWLSKNLPEEEGKLSYVDIVAKAEKDNWNPIYASYIYSEINKRKKQTGFKKLLNKKLNQATNNALNELRSLGEEAYNGVWEVLNYQGDQLLPAYRKNPRSTLYSLFKVTDFFLDVYPLDAPGNSNVSNYLTSNSVSDFDINNSDKKLKGLITNHLKGVAYAEAINLVSSNQNLVSRINTEKALTELLDRNDFAPTPNQVDAIRSAYSFFLADNKKGLFGNTAVLGGVTGSGKTKVFVDWVKNLLTIDNDNIFALGHTENSTMTINAEVPNANKEGRSIMDFVPPNVLDGSDNLTPQQVTEIAKTFPENIELFIMDEAFALTATAMLSFSRLTTEYNRLNESKAKFVVLGDPSQLTIEALDSISGIGSKGSTSNFLEDSGLRAEDVSKGFINLTFLPFLSINYRSNNFAIANAQTQYVGKQSIPENLSFQSSDKPLTSKAPYGAHSVDTKDQVLQVLANNLGNGRTKLVITETTGDAQRIVDDLGKSQMAKKVGKEFEVRVMAAIDAQGDEAQEVYILVSPDAAVNSKTYNKPIPLSVRKVIRNTGGKKELTYGAYNTIMYMLIGRAMDYVVLPAVAKGTIKQKVTDNAATNIQQFKIGIKENKDEYVAQLNEEGRILESLTGLKSKPINVNTKSSTETTNNPEETEETEESQEGAKSYKKEDTVLEEQLGEDDDIEEGTTVIVGEQSLAKPGEESRNEEFSDQTETKEEGRAVMLADNEKSETEEGNESTIQEVPNTLVNIDSEKGPWDMKIEHPVSLNIKQIEELQLQGEELEGKQVYFAKIATGKKNGFAIKVYYPIRPVSGKGSRDNEFLEIGEISAETFKSIAGQHLNKNLKVNKRSTGRGKNIIFDSIDNLIPATVNYASTARIFYQDKPIDPNPKVALRTTLDIIQNTFFKREQVDNKEIESEIVIATQKNTDSQKNTHPAFEVKRNYQLGAPYLYISAGNSKFVARLSMQALTSTDPESKILLDYLDNVDQLEARAKDAGFDIQMGTKEFSTLVKIARTWNSISVRPKKEHYDDDNNSKYYIRRFRGWKDNIDLKDSKKAGVSEEFVMNNLELINKLYIATHSVSVFNKVVTREEYEDKFRDKWDAVERGDGKFTLTRTDSSTGHIDHYMEFRKTQVKSSALSALYKLVVANQFENEDDIDEKTGEVTKSKQANDFIKAVRYKVKNRASRKAFNPSGLLPQSLLNSENILYKIIRDRFFRLKKKSGFGGLPDISNDEIDENNYKDYIKILEDFVKKYKNLDTAEITKSINDIKKYEEDYPQTKMTSQNLRDLLQFDENGISSFGDGTYLRKPLFIRTVDYWSDKDKTQNFEDLIDKASKVLTSNVSGAQATELYVRISPDNTTQTETQPTETETTEEDDTGQDDIPDSFDGFLDDDDNTERGFTEEVTNPSQISMEQAKAIAQRIIPGITDSQLEFVQMHLLNSKMDYNGANKRLGMMKGNMIKLGLVESTEKDPKVYEQVAYHELMHLLWNYYIPYSTKKKVIAWMANEYPETQSMNHIDLDEFISRKFQDYRPEEKEQGNLLQRLFDKFISWFNLLNTKEKSLYSLFEEIHQGKYSTRKDYSSSEFKQITKEYNTKITQKLNELVKEKEIDKECKGGIGGIFKAKDGFSNGLTKGGKWKVLKRFKGKSHEQGGIDITVSKSGIKMSKSEGLIEAKYGLVIPNKSYD